MTYTASVSPPARPAPFNPVGRTGHDALILATALRRFIATETKKSVADRANSDIADAKTLLIAVTSGGAVLYPVG
ncbi:hypothetical protein [Bradyrhizobium ottawaense]|uniref:hypothetical protein n=1 Tax=Bradyrhizobium ottawaense TaxID=931866 RepID=UPI001BAB2FB6|nr:hypothetical protein [Bradyrhizobium ottawaense]MBR1290144.1 hypothetical protein [Bradyrhizobium ottawaense]